MAEIEYKPVVDIDRPDPEAVKKPAWMQPRNEPPQEAREDNEPQFEIKNTSYVAPGGDDQRLGDLGVDQDLAYRLPETEA